MVPAGKRDKWKTLARSGHPDVHKRISASLSSSRIVFHFVLLFSGVIKRILDMPVRWAVGSCGFLSEVVCINDHPAFPNNLSTHHS